MHSDPSLVSGATDPQEAPDLDRQRFSHVLRRTADEATGPRITIAQMIDSFGRRGHGALLVALGAPNMIPLPLPGLSMLSGIPLLVVAVEMIWGKPEPWLPGFLARRSLASGDFRRAVSWLAPRLERLEKVVRPRRPLVTGPGQRLLGLVAFILAVALFLPLPFGNAMPGLALALIGLGMMERDGSVALAGAATAAVAVAVLAIASGTIAGLVWAGLRAYLP